MTTLALSHIDQFFGQGSARVQVLHDVSFEAEAGSLSLVLGPSGSGKSTFLTIAGGLLTPTNGAVSVAGRTYHERSRKEREALRLDQIGFVLQAYQLLPFLTVADQFTLVDKVHPEGNMTKEELTALLKALGIADLMKKYPNELSGGQKQRVAIARALYPDPALILADEPTAALDGPRVKEVGALFATLAHKRDKAVVVVTHDVRLREFADHVYQMVDGRLTQEV